MNDQQPDKFVGRLSTELPARREAAKEAHGVGIHTIIGAATRVLVLGVATVALVAGTMPPAAASQHFDPDDTAYRIDIRSARMAHDPDRRTYNFTITTYEKFYLRGGGVIWWVIDNRGGPDFDTKLQLFFDAGSDGIFCDPHGRSGGALTNIGVGGVGRDRLAACRFRVDKRGWRNRALSYVVIIKDFRKEGFRDRAPNVGRVHA